MVSQRQLRPIYEDPQTYETNNETTEVMDNEEELTSVEDMDELKDILVPDEIQHVCAFSSTEITTGFSAPRSDAASRAQDG